MRSVLHTLARVQTVRPAEDSLDSFHRSDIMPVDPDGVILGSVSVRPGCVASLLSEVIPLSIG